MAKKYFGKDEAIGKVIRKNNSENMVVTGVLANSPSNSHLQYDFILPMSSIASTNYDIKNGNWGNFNFYTYLELNKNFNATAANLSKLTVRIKEIYKTHSPNEDRFSFAAPHQYSFAF